MNDGKLLIIHLIFGAPGSDVERCCNDNDNCVFVEETQD